MNTKRIYFSDDILESLIKKYLKKENLDKKDLEKIDYLDISGHSINNLSGLEYCENLQLLIMHDIYIEQLYKICLKCEELVSIELDEDLYSPKEIVKLSPWL